MTAGDAFHPHLPGDRVKEGQQFGGALPKILMRLALGLTRWAPVMTRIRDCLIGTGFIFAPHRQTQDLRNPIRPFNQLFFASASGSITVTTPALRLRSTCPV